ncbi:DUF2255 family protein [Nocardia sp. A7]|uniref:DUF2255 family protein n=1 Tax=Nocardia sp. A7 TaxID=2789274 RepID=UPI00397C8B36
MSTWNEDELRRVGDARELHIATRRPDGTMRNPIPIWHVRVGSDIFVRSAHGPDNGWFRRAKQTGTGRIHSGGVEREVAFEPAPDELANDITATYHAKYDQYGPGPVAAVTGDDVLQTTLRVIPQD